MEIVHFLLEDIAHINLDLQNIISINKNHDWNDDEDYDFNLNDALLLA